MAMAFVQSRSVAGLVLAFNANVTVGNLLIVAVGSVDVAGGITFAISDSQGNVYTALALVDGNPNSGRMQIFYAIAKSTGANTVTLVTDSATPQLAIHEFSGAATFDTSAFASGSGAAQDSGPATTAQASELLFGLTLHVASNLGAVVAGAGWTQAESMITGITAAFFSEYQIVSATGNYNATSSSSGGKSFTDKWIAEIATYKASSSNDYQIGCRQHRTRVSPGMSA